jgi:cell division protein FtsW
VGSLNLKKQKKGWDSKLAFITFLLLSLGLIAVADASAPQAVNVFSDRYYFVKQQLIWGGAGVVLMLIVSRIKYSFWEKLATPLFWVSTLFLILVLIPGLGITALGAKRWLDLGFFSFQPSELTKLTLAIYLARVASKGKGSLAYIVPVGVLGLLIMLQPDLGTTIITVGIGMSQIFYAGISLVHILGFGAIGGLATIALVLTSSYRRARFLTFLQQSQDPLGRDYHIRQILLALGSGGIIGAGLGQSRQKYLFLPEAATDSIFAIIAEEVGFLGSLLLIVIFAAFIYRGILIARQAPDKFSQVLAMGITAWIGGQAILNIAAMVALVPLTGIPLPFFSYGGSSLVMILVACGILLSISRFTHGKIRKN